jgi:hypothetical protein
MFSHHHEYGLIISTSMAKSYGWFVWFTCHTCTPPVTTLPCFAAPCCYLLLMLLLMIDDGVFVD